MDDLIGAGALNGFSGAPFPPAVLKSAAGALRSQAGWHIAPEITQTIEIDIRQGQRVVLLPSLHVVKVTEIVNADDGTVLGAGTWRLRKGSSTLFRHEGWPETIEVTLTHGHAECPPELLAPLAERCQRSGAGAVRQESLGARSVSYAADYDASGVSLVDRHTLSKRP